MSKNSKNSRKLSQLANCIRFLSIDSVQKANSGHPGMPMGMADIATVLFKDHLKFDPNDPNGLIVTGLISQMVMAPCFFILAYI